MPQIINDPFSGSGGLGASFGSGVARGIENLAQLRLEEMSADKQQQRQRRAKALEREQKSAALSQFIPKELANSIVALEDKDLQNNILSNLKGLGTNIPGLEGQQVENIFESPTAKLNREKINLARESETRKAGEFEKTEARKALETQARISESGAKAGLAKAKTADIAENRALMKKNQQLRENIAKTDERIALSKNDIERQKLQIQRDKMQKQIGLNDKASDKLELDRQKYQLAVQKEINRTNKPYVDQIDKNINPAREAKNLALDIKSAIESGNVLMGPQIGKLASSDYTNWLVNNADTDKVKRAATKLATLEAQTLGGQVTNLKEKLAQNSKISLTQNPEAALDILDGIIEAADDIELKYQAKNNIIDRNGREQPKHIDKLVEDEFKKLKTQKNTEQFNSVKDLPDPKIESGEVFEDEDGSGYISDGKEWKKLTVDEVNTIKRGY